MPEGGFLASSLLIPTFICHSESIRRRRMSEESVSLINKMTLLSIR
jgi:hypothetical protein